MIETFEEVSDCSCRCIVTAGSAYLDIDAYACMVAMAELYRLEGREAVACSRAVCNYSVVPSLAEEGQVLFARSEEEWERDAEYVIVDVSDPEFLKSSVPLERVSAVFDHHVGFEAYWQERIGDQARIEFLGAAATLVYREWIRAGRAERMSRNTALLLIAAILDNTLNLTSGNTTQEDRSVFRALCDYAGVDETWCADYFSQVQAAVERDLRNALLNDTKTVRGNPVLPESVSQLCVWDSDRIVERIPEIRGWFDGRWMLNLIDIRRGRSCFVCDDPVAQRRIEQTFGVRFVDGIAWAGVAYLRKEIIKKSIGG